MLKFHFESKLLQENGYRTGGLSRAEDSNSLQELLKMVDKYRDSHRSCTSSDKIMDFINT